MNLTFKEKVISLWRTLVLSMFDRLWRRFPYSKGNCYIVFNFLNAEIYFIKPRSIGSILTVDLNGQKYIVCNDIFRPKKYGFSDGIRVNADYCFVVPYDEEFVNELSMYKKWDSVSSFCIAHLESLARKHPWLFPLELPRYVRQSTTYELSKIPNPFNNYSGNVTIKALKVLGYFDEDF